MKANQEIKEGKIRKENENDREGRIDNKQKKSEKKVKQV